ncbi:F-box/kelch-repeat protein At3g23880-like [Rosa rugosa]|uniref:F-box/kelch-repeat protein At3g23880-like n=1 Tax=Rosa rugosa TaxID=74645 RepID=UPI002B40967A|nr:F-box/kelch-repeat protein At3g23880-like [Rosa rugosa]
MSKLPEEMLVQILSRLPPRSLMRFKCIHMSWYTLINNPIFVDKHLFVSKHNKLSSFTTILFKRYVLRNENTDQKKTVLSLFNLFHNNDDGEGHHLDSVMEELHVPPSMRLKRMNDHCGLEFLELSGHCDGIICLTDFRENIVLCNPAIKEFKLLPLSSFHLSYPDGVYTSAVGFGYDLKSKCYKAVRVCEYGQDYNDKGLVTLPPKAEVYSLVTNSWKEIKADNLVKNTTVIWFHSWPEAAVPTYCKGIIYWSGKRRVYRDYPGVDDDEHELDLSNRIISFHIVDETFHDIPCPDVGLLTRRAFGLWNESLTISSLGESEKDSIDIWVLDDIEETWTKYVTLRPVVNILYPLTLARKSEQFLLVAIDECVVIFYNCCTGKFKYLPISGVFLNHYQAVSYVSSTVSIEGGNNVEEEISEGI